MHIGLKPRDVTEKRNGPCQIPPLADPPGGFNRAGIPDGIVGTGSTVTHRR